MGKIRILSYHQASNNKAPKLFSLRTSKIKTTHQLPTLPITTAKISPMVKILPIIQQPKTQLITKIVRSAAYVEVKLTHPYKFQWKKIHFESINLHIIISKVEIIAIRIQNPI